MTMRTAVVMSALLAGGCAVPEADPTRPAGGTDDATSGHVVDAPPPRPDEPERRRLNDDRDQDITVLEGDWGDARPVDIAAVLRATAGCFRDAADERAVEPVVVEPSPVDARYPITLFAAASGRTQVRLAVRDRRWAQFAFQFAHEYCHVLSNHRVMADHPFGWFNECLCETASLYALQTMARTWRESPPYPNWREYAASLGSYVEERCAQPEHCLPSGSTFSAWLVERLPALRTDPVRRADNVIVAKRLLPVFEESPEAWRAVRYLNLWNAGEVSSIEQYFEHWRNASPARVRPFIDRLQRRLAGE